MPDYVDEILNCLTSENGEIDYNEFDAFIKSQFKQVDIKAHALDTFRMFDKDNNGSIDRKELKLVMIVIGISSFKRKQRRQKHFYIGTANM